MTRAGPAPLIRTCWCGTWYGDDRDGHQAHQAVHGHRPVEAPPTPQQQEEIQDREEDT